MDLYAKEYSTREKIEKIRLQAIKMTARLSNNNALADF